MLLGPSLPPCSPHLPGPAPVCRSYVLFHSRSFETFGPELFHMGKLPTGASAKSSPGDPPDTPAQTSSAGRLPGGSYAEEEQMRQWRRSSKPFSVNVTHA